MRGSNVLRKTLPISKSRTPQSVPPFNPRTGTSANVVAVSIGGPDHYANLAVVTVTLCPSGNSDTQKCISVPNVQLDTGSVGLRLFVNAQGLDAGGNTVSASQWTSLLSPVLVTGSPSQNLVECYLYGGGDQFWGSIRAGDLILGGVRAAGVPIQVVDASFGTPVGDCTNPTSPSASDLQRTGYNGIFGINPLAQDCGDPGCVPGGNYDPQYYACAGAQCSAISSVPTSEQVPNPIAKMPDGFNNGYVLSFPDINADGRSQVSGTLTLGLATQANNTPSAQSSLQFFQEDSDGWLRFAYGGETYFSMFDTGTTLYYLPAPVPGIPLCASSGFWADWFCASPPQTISGSLMSGDQSQSAQVSLSIGDAESLYGSGAICLNNVGLLDAQVSQTGGNLTDTFIMGMPFLYGKTIYAGLGGKTTLAHPGPFDALEIP